MDRFDNVSPRQIRIFYYRYLIAKNLLIRKYQLLERRNIWLHPTWAKTFITLVIEYSKIENFNQLKADRTAVAASDEQLTAISLANQINVSTADYLELLNVLEVVIAY
jgi:hypothetical protein